MSLAPIGPGLVGFGPCLEGSSMTHRGAFVRSVESSFGPALRGSRRKLAKRTSNLFAGSRSGERAEEVAFPELGTRIRRAFACYLVAGLA